jgi:thiosulfate dehydrogenase
VATAYPAWSPREGRVISLEDRVLNCFMRSCNGVRPPLGSSPSVAITAYITWLSTGQAIGQNAKSPHGPRAIAPLALKAEKADRSRGEALYTERCARCHGRDGAGRRKHPPVWGEHSYNRGAGLADPDQLAAWLKTAMPLDDANLTEQEALDLAVYVNSKPRPDFHLKDHLPKDERLGEYNSGPGRGGK